MGYQLRMCDPIHASTFDTRLRYIFYQIPSPFQLVCLIFHFPMSPHPTTLTTTSHIMSSSPPPILKAYTTTDPLHQIHYRYCHPSTQVHGTPLIFLHKSASSSASYELLMRHYASLGYSCYAPDMPGFGGSFDPSEEDILLIQEQGTKWFCDVFVAFFVELVLWGKGGLHIIGHHSGACLALELAVLWPEEVKSICLVGPAVMSEEERAAMKEIYFKPFNEPVWDGSHLAKTWDYLRGMSSLFLVFTLLSTHIVFHKLRASDQQIQAWVLAKTCPFFSVKPSTTYVLGKGAILFMAQYGRRTRCICTRRWSAR